MDVKDTFYRIERQSWSNEHAFLGILVCSDLLTLLVSQKVACACKLLAQVPQPASIPPSPVFLGSLTFLTIWGWAPHWPCGCFQWSLLLPLCAVVLILAAQQMTWRRRMCCFRWARSPTWAQMLWVTMQSHRKRRLRRLRIRRRGKKGFFGKFWKPRWYRHSPFYRRRSPHPTNKPLDFASWKTVAILYHFTTETPVWDSIGMMCT